MPLVSTEKVWLILDHWKGCFKVVNSPYISPHFAIFECNS